ncbi:hypothetical protein C1A50_2602 [Paenibacillus polymyxa]|nr:hypothetical protein C1A50_2602 [Paenibacillus polymyxa]
MSFATSNKFIFFIYISIIPKHYDVLDYLDFDASPNLLALGLVL